MQQFQSSDPNDQLCYEIDINKIKSKYDFSNSPTKYDGLRLIIDDNEDRQSAQYKHDNSQTLEKGKCFIFLFLTDFQMSFCSGIMFDDGIVGHSFMIYIAALEPLKLNGEGTYTISAVKDIKEQRMPHY